MADTDNVNSQTDKFCPFAGMTINAGQVTGVFCIKEDCQLWVKNEVEGNADKFSRVTGENDPRGNRENTDEGRCGAQIADFMESLFRINHHIHNQHQHPRSHTNPNEYSDQNGGPFFGFGFSTMQLTTMEMAAGEDMNGDNKVYGIDYYIRDNDAPSTIQNMNQMMQRIPYHYVDWTSAKDGKFPPMLKNIYPNVGNTAGGTRVRITGGFFSGTLSSFEVKFGDSTGTNLNIVDSTTLYVTTPAGSEGATDITLTNSGNTFDSDGWSSLFLNTGGSKTYTNAFEYSTEADDPDIQEELEGLESLVVYEIAGSTTMIADLDST